MVTESKSELDKLIGMEVYSTDSRGVGGLLRVSLEDFVVEEIPLKAPSAGAYTVLVVEKRGIDTLTAAMRIARRLRLPLRDVGFAGLKDTRSVSRQRFTVKLQGEIDLQLVSDRNIKVLDVYKARKPLKPGMLLGNRFTVTIRDIQVSPKEAERLLKEAFSQAEEMGGFPNFYGYQRFGIHRPNTHVIGKFLVKGLYEEAVMELLTSTYPGEPDMHRRARLLLAETMDFKEALKNFPHTLVYERSVIKVLSRRPRDYLAALRSLPKSVLSLYVDAYLAYIFNKALSERLRKLRSLSAVVEGDIIARVDDYGNPLRPTRIAKRAGARSEQEVLMAFIPADTRIGMEGFMGEIIASVFKSEGVHPPFKSVEELGLQGKIGLIRPLSFKPKNLSFKVGGDLTVTLSFTLPKSSYATVLLRELMKPSDPIASGF